MIVEQEAIKEENRKIRFLRLIVDLSILSIQEGNLPFQEAMRRIEVVKQTACGLFPGKEEVFEWIYRPRFDRVLRAAYPLEKEVN